ncbi:hypothetical protein Nepgr_021929 [Nepenthes gracilis]|uniref:Uncharacterized protein n=1 Tax=Nepenthes gracilis TaxID=150966 RepID=A0AAD3SXN6_NEPGR|nr:hypothetical protein Nepgr_021929 [Nepenthes gracilis]
MSIMRKPSASPCCSKIGVKRGPWTPLEDEILVNYINKEGQGRWRTLPQRAGLFRCGKSCRLRWMNYLRPTLKKEGIAPDEEDLILRLHRLLGNRWSLIAGRIPGRTDNEIKNYWNTHLKKKLIDQGLDPRTHKPLDTCPNFSNHATTYLPALTTNPNLNHELSPNYLTNNETSTNHFAAAPEKSTCRHINQFANPSFKYPFLLPDCEESSRSYGNEAAAIEMAENLIQSGSQFAVHASNQNDWQSCDVGLMANQGNNSENFGFESCDFGSNDDQFSFFLNSLLNEDLFTSHHHQQQQPNVMLQSMSDPQGVCSMPELVQSSAWDATVVAPAAPTSSAGQLVQDNPKI